MNLETIIKQAPPLTQYTIERLISGELTITALQKQKNRKEKAGKYTDAKNLYLATKLYDVIKYAEKLTEE